MRCLNCGAVNPDTHRFCGTCGTALMAAPAASTPAQPVPSPLRLRRDPDVAREREISAREIQAQAIPPRDEEPLYSSVAGDRPSAAPPRSASASTTPHNGSPIITGPSFLGLNQSAPAPRLASLSIDPAQRSDLQTFDYLLNEEEEESKGDAWKYIVIVVALLVTFGIGYLRWKNQTQGWFSANKPPATDQAPEAANANPSAQPSAPPDVAKNPSAATTTNQPAPTPPVNPAATNPALTVGDIPPGAATANSADEAAKSDAADSAPAQPDVQVDVPPVAPPKKPVPIHAAKPKPTIPAKPENSNAIAEATRYIYGKGTVQDCDRGLRLLKPAASQSDPRAMIQMGALYSAGLCTPRDLPTAYRWFALSLRKEPDNMSVQNDLQKLWGEMTPPERQLAIRLSH